MKKILIVLCLLITLPAHAQGVNGVCALAAEYKPGEDVHGKAVVPADLGTPQTINTDKIDIPITVDLATKFGLALPAGVELKPDVALMSIYGDGRIEFNGTEISSKIDEVCSKTAVHLHRQKPPETLKSGGGDDVIQGIYPPE